MVVSGSNCYSAISNPPNLIRNLSAHSRLSNGIDDKLVSMRLTFHLQKQSHFEVIFDHKNPFAVAKLQ